MISPAQKFLDNHWPEEWPEYGENSDFYDLIQKEWEQEYVAGIEDRWIDFKKQTTRQLPALLREHEQEAADARREAIENR